MTATTSTTTSSAATSTSVKPKYSIIKDFQAPKPSAPTAPQAPKDKSLIYVRCHACNGGRAKVQFHHVVTLCALFLMSYALLSVVIMVHNSLDKEVLKTHVKVVKYNDLQKNYTLLKERYSDLQKQIDALKNKPDDLFEIPVMARSRLTPLVLQKHNADAPILSHSEDASETETLMPTESTPSKAVTTEEQLKEVTEKNQINEPHLTEHNVQDWVNKGLMKKIKMCIENPGTCY